MSGRAIALVTYSGEPTLTADDRLLQAALADEGCIATPVNWDAAVAWETFDAIIIRSPWDYYKRYGEFTAWLERLEAAGARVFNSASLLRWNSEKSYLRQLASAGVNVPPTEWIARGTTVSLHDLMRQRRWEQIVVKPTISATAYHTYRLGPDISAEDQARADELTTSRDVMIQPYLDEVASAGELSLLFFGGEFSHAVLKRPKAGDFRVQSDFGGTVEQVTPAAQDIAEAAQVLAAAPEPTLYARVDGCIVGGHFMLMELEIVEPCLFFSYDTESAARLAHHVRELFADSSRSSR
jgi:glutathione synthase/RimK-type ligase-like ATP-grasp enzyme